MNINCCQMKFKILVALLCLNSFYSFGKEFYIAPSGNDANDGTLTKPLETIKKAQELAGSGDVIYIRGGHYIMREEQITQLRGIWAYVTKLDKN